MTKFFKKRSEHKRQGETASQLFAESQGANAQSANSPAANVNGTEASLAAQSASPQRQLPLLTPEWEAFRQHAFSMAADASGPFAANDFRAAVPEALRPGQHKVHHAYIWLGSVSVLAAVIFAVVASSIQGIMQAINALSSLRSDAFAMAVVFGCLTLLVLLIVILVVVLQWLSWKHLHYQLTPTEFNLHSGVLNKKRLHLPYQRVQAVNQQAGVLQRLLGLCNVKIDTAGGSANEAVSLRYLRNADAEALRLELFRRKKVLLAGGTIDEWGNAFVESTVLPSAWMTACCNGDGRAAATILGGFQANGAPSAGTPSSSTPAPQTALTTAFASTANAGNPSNALDALDNMLTDVRGVFGGSEIATGNVSFETGLSNKELLLAGISKAGGSFGIMLLGALGVLGLVMEMLPRAFDAWIENAVESVIAADVPAQQIADNLLSGAVLSMAGFTIMAVGGMWALSALATIIRYGGFKARRRESRIEVEHGLLQRTFHGVDIDRVQSVIIKQSFIRRCLGYCELQLGKIDSTSEGEGNNGNQLSTQGVVIHPFAKMARVSEILQGIAPELANMPQEVAKPAPAALRRAVIRMSIIRSSAFWMALAALMGLALLQACEQAGFMAGMTADELGLIAMLHVLLWILVALFVLAFAINTTNAVLWHKHSSMGYDRYFMSITNGGLSTQTVMFPRKKIQFATAKTNPFQRRVGVQTVCVRTAAGIGGTTETLRDVANHDVEAWMDWVMPGGNQKA